LSAECSLASEGNAFVVLPLALGYAYKKGQEKARKDGAN